MANAGRTASARPTVLANCSIHVAPLLKWWPPFAYGALGISRGFSMKSGGVLASPYNAKAFPGSERLVPKTTSPAYRDCAAGLPVAPTQRTAAHETSVITERVTDFRPIDVMRAPLLLL